MMSDWRARFHSIKRKDEFGLQPQSNSSFYSLFCIQLYIVFPILHPIRYNSIKNNAFLYPIGYKTSIFCGYSSHGRIKTKRGKCTLSSFAVTRLELSWFRWKMQSTKKESIFCDTIPQRSVRPFLSKNQGSYTHFFRCKIVLNLISFFKVDFYQVRISSTHRLIVC